MVNREYQGLIHGPGWRPDIVERLGLDGAREQRIIDFCNRWRVADLELFGSVLRPDFGPGSDVDLLVTFHPNADWGLIEHAAMEEELAGLLGRPVDLLTRRSVERSANQTRRASILSGAVLLLSAAPSSSATERVGA
jgi:predicted nucleotidyltransferase